MAANQTLRQAELAPERAHLVLEQLAQRLDQLHLHARRQAAHVVVRLDGDAGAAGEGDRLDDVGIERALRQEIRTTDLRRLLIEEIGRESCRERVCQYVYLSVVAVLL